MQLVQRVMAGLFCCLLAAGASAQTTPVSLTADFSFASPAPFAGTTLAVSFTAPDRAADFDLPGVGFGFYGLPGVLTIDGVVRDTESSLAGWFAYDSGYNGIDVRFTDVFAAGDEVQIILETAAPLFDRIGGTPVLQGVSLTGLGGQIVYYTAASPLVAGVTSAGTYVAVVPEPATAALGLLGLLLIGWRVQRHG